MVGQGSETGLRPFSFSPSAPIAIAPDRPWLREESGMYAVDGEQTNDD